MSVPAPNLYPDFNIIRLSHVCLNVKDLVASCKFYTEILGLQVTDKSDTHIYLRAMEERGHHCIILQKSDQPGTVEVMGFKTFDEDDLDRAEAYFKVAGDAIQLHGGIGFTWEYPLHLFFKRARANRAMFGVLSEDYKLLADSIFGDKL